MAHASLKLIPGVDINKTPALNEAAISASNLIRFMPDRTGSALPQKIGGWQKFYSQAMPSDVKALWGWADSNSDKFLAVGMVDGISTLPGTDRTPNIYEIDVAPDFSTTADNPEVDIVDVGSNLNRTANVFIMTPVSVGGLVLFGLYPVIAQSSDSYSVDAINAIGALLPATSTVSNGGALPVFDTLAADPSITVTLADHGYTQGSNFAILVPVTVGGITLKIGNYTVQSVPSSSTFTIFSESAPTATDTVTMNGGDVKFRYYVGRQGEFHEQLTSGGYGTGGYGRGGYGTGVTTGVGRQFDTTAASGVGTIATLTYAEPFTIPVGSYITVEGVTPNEFNGNFVVSASSSGSVSYDAGTAVAGPQTVAGTISVTWFTFAPVEDWTLDNWGGDLIATPQNGGIFGWSPLDGGTEVQILPNAPTNNQGALVAMPQRQIIAYGSTFNDIQDPLLVRWCDINNYTRWLASPTNQAGSYRLTSGSKIVGAVQASAQVLLWTDISIWSMQYVGFPGVYSFNELSRGCGLIAKKAVGTTAGGIFWMGQSQFFRMAGSGIEPMVCPVWDIAFQDLDRDYASNIRCGVNSRFSEIMWFFPTNGSGGVPTKYVKYNYMIDQWDYGDLARTAWIDQTVFDYPIAAGSNRYIYSHEVGEDADGEAINASFTTGYFALADGDQLSFVDQFWPDMKWALYGDSGSGTVNITFYVAEYPGDTPKTYGPYAVTKNTQYITPRFRGRLVAFSLGSEDIGSFWRLGNPRYRFQPDGKFL